jgi:ribosomal protein L6P/L9E
MTGAEVEAILSKAESDDAFLGRLLADPRAAAAEVGATLSDTEVQTLKGMNREDVRAFAAEYRSATDPEKRRAAC